MPEREAEWEETFETVGSFGTVHIRAYIERYRGSRDEVVVHTYIGDRPDADHDIHRFNITDEKEQICKYKPSRGKSEPKDIGLWALKEYGWDCANFSLPDDDEKLESDTEMLTQAAQAFVNMSDDTAYEPVESLLVDAAASLQAAAALLQTDDDGTPGIERFMADDDSMNFDASVPESHNPEKTAVISDVLTDKMSEVLAEASNADGWVTTDERTIRGEDKSGPQPRDDEHDVHDDARDSDGDGGADT